MPIHSLGDIMASAPPQEVSSNPIGDGFSALSDAFAPQQTPPFFDPNSHQAQPLGGHEGHGDHAGGMNPRAEAAWNKLLALYPNLTTSSTFRTVAENNRVGGADHSQHLSGNAYDVPFAGRPQDELSRIAADAYRIFGGGMGFYDNSFHFDVGPKRHWGSDYTGASTPQWGLDALRSAGY